jgi:hypothetical protein
MNPRNIFPRNMEYGREKHENEIRKMELCGVADYIGLCVDMQKRVLFTLA